MVRLREANEATNKVCSNVSIPIWCDWELRWMRLQILLLCCFNSNMVRLRVNEEWLWAYRNYVSIPIWCDWEVEIALVRLSKEGVSIPIWCDWEAIGMLNTSPVALFQFQYGAIESQKPFRVLWVSVLFQFQYGAIESLYHRNIRVERCCFNSNMVRLRGRKYKQNNHLI